METTMTVGERIKLTRSRAKLTQFAVSLKTRVPSYRLSAIENGRVQPTRRELQVIAKVLGVHVEDLEGTAEPSGEGSEAQHDA